MNISTLDIDELGKGRIRHYLEGKQWSEKQQAVIRSRKWVGEHDKTLMINRIRQLYENETYH